MVIGCAILSSPEKLITYYWLSCIIENDQVNRSNPACQIQHSFVVLWKICVTNKNF